MRRKQFIALKSFAKQKNRFYMRLRRNPEMLAQVSQASDVAPNDIMQLFEQMLGKKEVTLIENQQLEIAWYLLKAAMRITFLEDGFESVLEGMVEHADELGISVAEFQEFLREIIVEIAHEIFSSGH